MGWAYAGGEVRNMAVAVSNHYAKGASPRGYPSLAAYGDAWREIRRKIDPLEERIQQRPTTSWTDCLERAEVAWWGIQHRGIDRYTNHAAVALTEAVLSLGGGERFYLYDKRSS
jgi:hypothetical protein